jgi:predicted membrane channel-forming protein YqfA (hemolysin III family)
MKTGVVYFRFVAIVFILSGILGLVFADQYISLLSADGSVGGRLWGRAFGAVSFAFGVMYWMMDPSGDQRARWIGAVGAALAFGLTGLGDFVSVLGGDLPAYGWAFVVFHAVMIGLALYYLFTPTPLSAQEDTPGERVSSKTALG